VFRALGRPQGRSRRGPVRAAFVPVPSGPGDALAQVGYVIGRRCGNAVTRNRLRRRLRAAVREVATDVPPGAYLLGTGPDSGTIAYADLVVSVRQAMAAAAGSAPQGPGR